MLDQSVRTQKLALIAERPVRSVRRSDFSGADLTNLILILLLCGVIAYLRWLKMDTLVWSDPPRWLFEAQRMATGDVPYRDFSWSYPPLSVLLFGAAMKVFGVTFAVAQILVDLLSLAVVLLAYALIRRLFPRFLHLPVVFCIVAICSTDLVLFNLFSLTTYVPAQQTGAAGLLLLMIGMLAYARRGRFSSGTWLLIGLGAFIASCSKVEAMLAAGCTLAALAIVDRYYWFSTKKTSHWMRHYATVAAVCAGPALLAYVAIGATAGFANLREGLLGYGVAGTACPWWPTGLGTLIAAASLAKAAFAASALSLTRRKWFFARFGAVYRYGVIAGMAGIWLYAPFAVYQHWNLQAGSHSILEGIRSVAGNLVWSSSAAYFLPQPEERLVPVMWTLILLWLYLAVRILFSRPRKPSAGWFELFVIITGPVAMSARGWFNWHFGVTPTTPGLCYPFFILLAVYLMWRLLAIAGPDFDPGGGIRTLPGGVLAGLLVAYGILRLASGYPSLFSDAPYQTLRTEAGDIHLTQYSTDSEIYRFIMENTAPADTILDIPYGGGMSVATHRGGHLFSTMFTDLRMSDRLLDQDFRMIQQYPPKVVIAENQANLGASYGLIGCTCAFPRLVWIPPTSSIVPDKVFPAIRYVQENYRVAKVIGRKQLLVPK